MKLIYNQQQIDRSVIRIAEMIHHDHHHDPNPPVMIGVLNGSFMFFSELVKHMHIECEIDFIQAKSYNEQHRNPEVKITKDIDIDVKGKNVYLIDDILDSGQTLKALISHLEHKHKPSSITPIVLLKRCSNLWPIVHGLELKDDTHVFGFGLDGPGGLGRNKLGIFGI